MLRIIVGSCKALSQSTTAAFYSGTVSVAKRHSHTFPVSKSSESDLLAVKSLGSSE